ncbi:hypothetical protein L7F22_033188 [Adiantum nelumboides]|nr:hypothetical protein [Adiantum nelumboides]
MENALDKLDDLEYELEKAYEWLDDHKGDKRKSCSSRKKVCMLQKACERLRDAYEDEFEEESSDEDDDGWVCMESLVHQVGIPKMEEKETKKEAGQKSLEEPLDNLILPLECAHGMEEEYPLLKITPILSNERMEIGIWREDLKIQESQKDFFQPFQRGLMITMVLAWQQVREFDVVFGQCRALRWGSSKSYSHGSFSWKPRKWIGSL